MYKTIELTITTWEAHAILRALATANASESTSAGDVTHNNWVAERLLRILSPDLGPRPIDAIHARGGEIANYASECIASTVPAKARKRAK